MEDGFMSLIPNPSITFEVIFEDDSIIIVNKPAGLPVYPLKDNETLTLANGLVARWPDLSKIGYGEMQTGLLHRLDNDTSGIILVAKTGLAFEDLHRQFNEESVLKEYTTLVLGETKDRGIIETPIIHDPKNKRKMKVVGEGLTAHTTYYLIKKYLAGQYSLLQVQIKTGVRHQIRVHLASIGHPIAGDKLYQTPRQKMRDKTGLSRQFLHASKIGFNHPISKKWIGFTSNLPDEIQNVLTKLILRDS